MKDKKNIILVTGLILVIIIVVILLLLKGCQKEYTVTFDSNGGTQIESIKVKENETVGKPIDPVKEDYYFKGWYLDNELYDFETKIKSDITLKAEWTKGELQISSEKLNLTVEESKKLEVTKIGIEEELQFISSDESIATVDEEGNIKAIKEGTVTITVQTKDGKYKATCEVTVSKGKVEVSSIEIGGATSVVVGNSIKLNATVSPSNATNKEITWKSSDKSIATVDKNGNVKGLKEGTVTITATTKNGTTKSITITVKKKGNKQPSKTPTPTPSNIAVTKVKISGKTTVYEKEKIKLTATVSPSNATNKEVTWKSSNKNIATVDKNGNVTGVKKGTVTITATAKNGKKATYKVTVKEKEAKYVIYLTGRVMEATGAITQYDFKVTKNGAKFTGYLGFTYNGHLVPKDTGSVSSTIVDKKVKTGRVTLKDGSVKTATVIIR